MRRFLVARSLHALATALGVSLVVFFLARLSGNPAALLVPLDASQAEFERMTRALGLDRPIWIQYGVFLRRLMSGDFGMSLRGAQPALSLVLERMPATALLAGSSLLIAVILGLPLGIMAAVHQNRLADRFTMVLALVGQSMPVFWLGLLLVVYLSVRFRLLPTSGYGTPAHLVLPAITLALYSMGRLARMTRSSMLEVMREDYVRTAHAKGLHGVRVLWRHALRNALVPVVTLLGLDLAALLGGAVVTETVFAWPGIGRLAIQAIETRDFPVVQAVVAIASLVYVLLNMLVDVVYALLDPQIRVR